MADIHKYSNLQTWIRGESSLPTHLFKPLDDTIFMQDINGWIALDICVPLHEVSSVQAQSLRKSWDLVDKYVRSALDTINYEPGSEEAVDLDHEDADWIKDHLGEPPSTCYPLYFITLQRDGEEKLAYIGQTSAEKSRFAGGHSAAIALHNPIYDEYAKYVYFGCVTFYRDEHYLPLEWIHPLSLTKSILNALESQLIYIMQPELNIMHKRSCSSNYNWTMQIDNHTDRPVKSIEITLL